MTGRVAVVEVIGVGIVEIDGFLHQVFGILFSVSLTYAYEDDESGSD